MKSLYGDIALTLAKLLVDGNESSTFSGFDVCDVKVNRPLVLQPSVTSQLFRVSATADWPSKLISVSIYSVDQGGKALADHVTLKVRLVENTSTWLAEWTRMAYLINARISSLRQGVVNGRMHHLKRPMVYKLFTSIVDYCPEYQGLEEVILDSDELEAVAQVSFQVDQDGYNVPPFWIDSLGQIAGFIMNGNEHLQADKQVFINHGWGSMRFGEPLQREKVYTTYNRMQLIEGTLYAGDTYILDGNRIVAVYERVTVRYTLPDYSNVKLTLCSSKLSPGRFWIIYCLGHGERGKAYQM
jgi:iterative type I PKS product template protein